MKANLKIVKQLYHHHALEIISNNRGIEESFLKLLEEPIELLKIKRRKKKIEIDGIKADELNKELRRALENRDIQDLKFEAFEEDGVFYFSENKRKIAGFDFAIINDKNNLIRLRNLCYGRLQYADRNKRWAAFLKNNERLKPLAEEIIRIGEEGKDLEDDLEKVKPLIVGEIQFGNWGLVYRDFFKVLKADIYNSIDCLIYIVPTGRLESLLSDGIVTYDGTEKIIKEFEKVLTVPIWLIGIDIEEQNNE
ncbi:BglII/BstYI family type II restriction endonuclease [Myroides odoratimimus]|uniref:BglII/BstYI family type II restriction endonuclease n=1 Tax=Myroides odoratimimus TaxID=76832 RepID=UPI0031016AB7